MKFHEIQLTASDLRGLKQLAEFRLEVSRVQVNTLNSEDSGFLLSP